MNRIKLYAHIILMCAFFCIQAAVEDVVVKGIGTGLVCYSAVKTAQQLYRTWQIRQCERRMCAAQKAYHTMTAYYYPTHELPEAREIRKVRCTMRRIRDASERDYIEPGKLIAGALLGALLLHS